MTDSIDNTNPVTQTIHSALDAIDAYEDEFIVACRELRAHAAAVFAATTDEDRIAALKAGLDAEYELVGDCDLFDSIAEQFGLEDAIELSDESTALLKRGIRDAQEG